MAKEEQGGKCDEKDDTALHAKSNIGQYSVRKNSSTSFFSNKKIQTDDND